MDVTGLNWDKSVAELLSSTSHLVLSESHWYLLAYYWSISTMFSGCSFLVPMTAVETLFSIVGVLLGGLFASNIISSMAAMLIERQDANRELQTRESSFKATSSSEMSTRCFL